MRAFRPNGYGMPTVRRLEIKMPNQIQMFHQALAPRDVVYTPDWLARDLVEWFKPSGRILEPCRGNGAIFSLLPDSANWCEIQEGADFFRWTEPVDWIVSNPPYSIFKEFLLHAMDISENVVYLVPLYRFFNSGVLVKKCWIEKFWVTHVRVYGTARIFGYSNGNPIAAIHWLRGWQGDTSWSRFGEQK